MARAEMVEGLPWKLAEMVHAHGLKLLGAGLAASVLAIEFWGRGFAAPLLAVGVTLVAMAVCGKVLALRLSWRRAVGERDVAFLAASDPSPCLTTGPDGQISYLNDAARKRFRDAADQTLIQALGELFANPSSVVHRLQERATAFGGAREDVITRHGMVRLTVTDAGGRSFFWRFDEIAEARICLRGGETLGIPTAVVSTAGTVLFMNEALIQLIGGRVKHLDRIVKDSPVRPGEVHTISATNGTRPFRLLASELPGQRIEYYFLPADSAAPRPAAASPGAVAGIEDLPVGLLELSGDGAIVAANRLARELLRPEGAGDLAGEMLSDQLEGLGRSVGDWLADAAQGRGLGRPEVLRVCGPDSEIYLQVTLGRVAASNGVRLLAVLNDATELKTLEAQFVQSQKMQAIGQLAGGVAHDFNNLLTAISGHCDLMLLRHDQGDPDYADLVQIHQNANRAAALVGQLLAFSRKQTLKPEVIDLRDTLSDLTHLLNWLVGERITLSLHHEAGLPPIRADRRQLEQVIMNLVVNARDAMPEGGAIRVESTMKVLGDELRRDRAKVPPGRYVVVKVEDQGIGIPSDKLQKIFEPFYTTKRVGEGTGLGLSTAYGIVKQSGGFIFVDSVVGSGTVFTLYFPAHAGLVEVHSSPAVSLPAAASPLATPPPAIPRAAVPKFTAAKRVRAASTAAIAVDIVSESVLEPRLVPESAPQPGSNPVLAEIGFIESTARADEFDAEAAQARRSESAASSASATEINAGAAEADLAETAQPEGGPAARLAKARGLRQGEPGAGAAKLLLAPSALGGVPAAKPEGEGVILLVEDEAPVRAFASRALRMRGYTVIEAESAEEALETLRDPSLDVDLFVTDVIMPGLDGPTWVRKALETRPHVKVVFVSGYAEDSFGEAQARIPNSVFLPKPFSLSELTSTVQDQLH